MTLGKVLTMALMGVALTGIEAAAQGKLRPIDNRPDAALAPDGGGSQPPRRLPACPTSRQRFHFYVVHPGGRVQPPCSEFHTIIAVSAIITTLVVPAIALAHIPFFQSPINPRLFTRISMKISTKGINTPLATCESRISFNSGSPGISTHPAPTTMRNV